MHLIKNKIIAILLVTIIAVGNFALIGNNIATSYASSSILENQKIVTNHQNVTFDAYFKQEERKIHSISQNIVEKGTFYIDVQLKGTGYLKEATIQIDANFKVEESYQQEEIQKIENNKIELNQINGNVNKTTIVLPIYFDANNTVSISNLKRQNKVTLKGTYIDDAGKEHNIEKTILNELTWTATPQMEIEQSIEKYVPYTMEKESGIIIEQKVRMQIKDNVLPMAESNVEIAVPQIQNVMPKIIVRKQEENTFNEDNWNYNENNGKLIIKETNIPSSSGEIAWKTKEEYIIQYRYENIEKQEQFVFPCSLSATMKVYGVETGTLAKTDKKDVLLTETIGKILEVHTEIVNENISKGYLYANMELPYQTKYIVDVAHPTMLENNEEIVLTINQDQFVYPESKILANAYFKQIKMNKENFRDILGKDGSITIYANKKEIGKITFAENEEETLEIDIAENNLKTITLRISKPQKEGILTILANKAIPTENNMTEEQIKNTNALETSASMQVTNKTWEDEKSSTVSMLEPTSKLNVEISKSQFSTVVEKEEVEIKATLKNNTEYDSLYQNPSIDIVLPKEMEKVEILGTELLYEENLKIQSVQLINGNNKIIRVKLSGNQTKYNKNEVALGATIVIRANVTINDLTPTKAEKIQVLYTNEKSSLYENITQDGRGVEEIAIRYIAPTGLVPINTISNFADNKFVRSIAGSSEQGILEVSAESKIATSEIRLINNYTNKINNISILGRALVKDVTDTSIENSNLENTFNANMVSKITTNELTEQQYKVYYSENGEATKDLSIASNGWTQTPTNLESVKSYLIVVNDYAMNTGDSITFYYQMQIPEGLNYNEKVDSVYRVYFDNVQKEQTIKDSVVARGVSLTTGQAPKLETNLTSYLQEKATIREGQYIKLKAEVKNTGNMDATNVKLNITAPSGNIYYYIENEKINFTNDPAGKEAILVATYKTKHTQFVEDDYVSEYEDSENVEKTIEIGNLKAGESKVVEYELKVEDVTILTKDLPMQDGKLVAPEIVIKTAVDVISDKMPKAITSNQVSFVLEEGKMQIMASTDKASDYILTKGDNLNYTVRVENITTENSLKNLEITVHVPQGLKIVKATTKNKVLAGNDKNVEINTNANTVTFKMEEYSRVDSIDFVVETQIESAQGTISPTITAKAENIEEHTSNIVSNKVQLLNFSIHQQTLDKEYFKEGEEITYTYKVKNNSEVYANHFVFENEMPEGTTFQKAEIVMPEGTQQMTSIEGNKLVIEKDSFQGQEEITIKVTVVANKLSAGEKEKQIRNNAVIYGDLFEKVESNYMVSIIEYNKNAHQDDAGQGNNMGNNANGENGRYSISGTAWIDLNKNGQREENEQKIEGLKVRLINQENQATIKDIDSGKEKVTTTTDAGEYTFDNLVEGKYMVVFEYENAKYLLTQYQKDDVSKLVNSDAIAMEMKIDGNEKIVAVSDTLTIADSNIRNIDIGMYVAPKVDLSLEKYISKVTLTYGDTTKSYDYNHSKIAKVEIPGKNLADATVVVEYKIAVTNEGDIGSYVKKIVDYIPTDMKFNAELNKDWYQSSNGDLYNASLANVKLEPGETKEVTLTLSKKKTSDNAEIINNNAEIYEVYNEEGISDIDSTEANKVSKEDDMSSADLVISIKTGEMISLVGIISSLICITIAVGAYVFYKKMKKITYPRRRG